VLDLVDDARAHPSGKGKLLLPQAETLAGLPHCPADLFSLSTDRVQF